MAEELTFEKVWAALMENREQQRETDRIIKEMARENLEQRERDRERMEKDREQREKDRKQLEKQMKETDRIIGELGNGFGELAEHLVAPSIMEKFNDLNFTFENTSQNLRIMDKEGHFLAEIDILLENGDKVIAVEVKAKPLQKDVDEHVSRMELLRRRADLHNDRRKFQGAIAGAIMNEEVRGYAHKAGFYVIEQTGDTVKINIPQGFTAREW